MRPLAGRLDESPDAANPPHRPLHAKRLVIRGLVGRSFVYRPAVTREVIDQQRTTTALSTLFGSEPRPAIATLVDAVESIDPELLDELARVIRRRRSNRGT